MTEMTKDEGRGGLRSPPPPMLRLHLRLPHRVLLPPSSSLAFAPPSLRDGTSSPSPREHLCRELLPLPRAHSIANDDLSGFDVSDQARECYWRLQWAFGLLFGGGVGFTLFCDVLAHDGLSGFNMQDWTGEG